MTDQVAITHNGTEYSLKDLFEAPMIQLVQMYNELASVQGLEKVDRFESKTTGAKRVWDRLMFSVPSEADKKEAESTPPAPTEKKEVSPRKKREMYFHLPVLSTVKAAREGTLRHGVLKELLGEGLTFDQVVSKVVEFDNARRLAGKDMKGADEHPKRRAYEVVRLIHYNLGYGIRQSPEGVITAFYDKE